MNKSIFRRFLSLTLEKTYNYIDKIHSYRIRKFYKDKNIDCVIDVGSHKGEFINSICEDHIPIFSFEPQMSVRHELMKNTQGKNVLEYFDYALSSYSGFTDLHISHLTSTSSTLAPDEQRRWIRFKKFLLGGSLIAKTVNVNVEKLDNILLTKLKSFNSILLKIDVEGAESDVLIGAKNIICNQNIKFIQIEISSPNKYKKALDILNKNGFIESKKFLFPLLNFSDFIFVKK